MSRPTLQAEIEDICRLYRLTADEVLGRDKHALVLIARAHVVSHLHEAFGGDIGAVKHYLGRSTTKPIQELLDRHARRMAYLATLDDH
jgi:hypothetical protein